MKIAVVCDWLVTYAGAEKVLEQILNVYPEADLFDLVDFLDEDKSDFIKHKKVTFTGCKIKLICYNKQWLFTHMNDKKRKKYGGYKDERKT